MNRCLSRGLLPAVDSFMKKRQPQTSHVCMHVSSVIFVEYRAPIALHRCISFPCLFTSYFCDGGPCQFCTVCYPQMQVLPSALVPAFVCLPSMSSLCNTPLDGSVQELFGLLPIECDISDTTVCLDGRALVPTASFCHFSPPSAPSLRSQNSGVSPRPARFSC